MRAACAGSSRDENRSTRLIESERPLVSCLNVLMEAYDLGGASSHCSIRGMHINKSLLDAFLI